MVAAMCLVMSSCLKDDNSSYVPPVDPAQEDSVLTAFADAHGYNMVTQSDSLHYYVYHQETGLAELKGVLLPYLYYEIVEQGNMTPDSTEVPDSELGGSHSGNTTVFNTVSDTTLYVSVSYTGTLLDGTVFDKTDDGKSAILALPALLTCWQTLIPKIGRGGHIRILSPSYYGYANQSNGQIPANSPLYFDIKVNGFIRNNYK